MNFTSTQQAGIGPHQRWAVGLLTDNATLPNAPANSNGGATGISYSDRGNHGSGQGWAMGWGVVWNVTTPYFVVQEPNLPAGITLANATGSSNGNPFIAVPGADSLGSGQSATVTVQFRNPSNASITFTPIAFSGNL
jgi:hypothetical protein